MNKKLKDWLPREFFSEFQDSPINGYLDIAIAEEHIGDGICSPFAQKHIRNWCQLENGFAVAWNENPARGWNFYLKNNMKTLKQLKTEATKSCNRRGHKMGKWEDHKNQPGSISTCKVCGKWVQVLVKPMPNEIDIGGPAVAVECKQ